MPNRILKESICTSENLNALDTEAEVFLYRLIVTCDDYGIFFANPSILRAKCFPLRIDKIKDKDIDKWINALINANLIFIYEYEGRQYLKLSKWENHQQSRAAKSKYPTPDMDGIQMISNDIQRYQMQAESIQRNPLLANDIQRNPLQANDIQRNPLQANAPVFVSVSVSEISNRDKQLYATNVKMKVEEYSKLCEEFGEELIIGKIEDLNNWKGGKGKVTKDDYLTIRAWIRKDNKTNQQGVKRNEKEPTKLW